MAPWDLVVLLGFAAYALAAGLRSRRRASTDLEQYFLAGRDLTGWRAGLSMAATQFAADTPLLVTGLVATVGIFGLWRLWIYALAFLLLGYVLAPCWQRAGVLTDAELCELRYPFGPSPLLRIVKALYFGTLFNCVVLAMVLWAAKEIAEPFLLWHDWLPAAVFEPIARAVEATGLALARHPDAADVWLRSTDNLISIAALLAFTTLYSAVGGLRAVVRTDVAQLAVMLCATLAYTIWAVDRAGGLDVMHETLRQRYSPTGPGGLSFDQLLAFTPDRSGASGALLAVIGLQWLLQLNADGTGYLAQRTMACRTPDDARRASIVFCFVQILVRSLLWLPLALALLTLYPPSMELAGAALSADREASFVRGMSELPVGLRGLMLTAMLAALASTIDTHLNWGASYWTHDLYERFLAPRLGAPLGGRALVRVARLSTLGVLALSLTIVPFLSSIQTAWQMSLLLGCGTGVMLVLRWIWWRVTAAGELAALAASLVLTPLALAAIPPEQEALRLLGVAFGSTLAGVAVSLHTSRGRASELAEFHARVKPPGFWLPVPGATRNDVGDLARGLGLAATTALACFALLVGFGTLLVGAPAPSLLPWPGVWAPGLLLLGGLLLARQWSRRRRQESAR